MVYAVVVADQPSASDLALVTEDHAEKHLVLSDQMIQEENTTVHPETKVNYFDSGDAEERRHVELLLQDYSQVFVGKPQFAISSRLYSNRAHSAAVTLFLHGSSMTCLLNLSTITSMESLPSVDFGKDKRKSMDTMFHLDPHVLFRRHSRETLVDEYLTVILDRLCQVYKPRRHQRHGNLQPLLAPPTPYYMVSIDFLLSLPKSTEGNDSILVIVDKFSKQVMLEPCKNNVTAAECARLLYNRLLMANWGLPKVIISDRGRRFLAALWETFWERVGTKLLHSTAYHPQTDGQTERTIQTIESAVRMYVSRLEDVRLWQQTLPRLQFEFNNAKTETTGRSPNELVMGLSPDNVASLLFPDEPGGAARRSTGAMANTEAGALGYPKPWCVLVEEGRPTDLV
ncbi:uncharacterized protein CPUR_03033 [Claviceps purpurea 20.1]|uniref:Integrase catalytic domain-containing protein n=1 Tax=Claviceps purpurea (strain 20.1) TaxID=1111077 RepID=M1W4J5_CLAP2|nr:uncharacterized protein CPUR_03033 [Claviceps purpurea 20.1]